MSTSLLNLQVASLDIFCRYFQLSTPVGTVSEETMKVLMSTLSQVEAFVTRVRKAATQPLCVGFGISTAEQAGQIAGIADGIIVGSRIIQLMGKDDDFSSLTKLVRGLRASIDKSKPL